MVINGHYWSLSDGHYIMVINGCYHQLSRKTSHGHKRRMTRKLHSPPQIHHLWKSAGALFKRVGKHRSEMGLCFNIMEIYED